MVTANQTLVASSNIRVAIVLTELNSLVDPAVAVTKVRSLRIPQMEAKTLSRADVESSDVSI